jgi:hypothetical protein
MLENLLRKYDEKFGEDFPTIPLGWGRTKQELCDLIQLCIDTNEDVYAKGLVVENNEVLY